MEDIASVAIISAMASTLITSLFIWTLGARGIVPALVTSAAVTALVTAYHSRRAAGPMPAASLRDGLEEAIQLFKIGGAFLLSAALMVLGAYLVRRTVRDSHGLHAAGLYQAAWTLGGTYVGFVLQAMGTDFYPRLTSTLGDDAGCNAMVNEQAHVSILLAGPGVAATLALAPAVLAIFYDTTFHGAIEPLRWMTLGMFLRVVSWPMGFIILARGATMMFIVAEAAAFTVHVGLAVWLTPLFGVTGAAAAFAGLYAWHACFVERHREADDRFPVVDHDVAQCGGRPGADHGGLRQQPCPPGLVATRRAAHNSEPGGRVLAATDRIRAVDRCAPRAVSQIGEGARGNGRSMTSQTIRRRLGSVAVSRT